MNSKTSKPNYSRWGLFMMIFGLPTIYGVYSFIQYYTSEVSEKGQYETKPSWDICINSYAYNYDEKGVLRPIEIFPKDNLNYDDGYKHPVRKEYVHCDIR